MSSAVSTAKAVVHVLAEFAIVLAVILTPVAAQNAATETTDRLIKAGFIAKFPAYTTWPAPSRPSSMSSFRFCIVGADAISEQLEFLIDTDGSVWRDARVDVIDQPSTMSACHLLYIPSLQSYRIKEILTATRDRSVLLVSDTPGLSEQGVHINLYREDERIKLEINRDAVEASGLRISFRLLELARIVD